MSPWPSICQELKTCSPKGRDCIEGTASQSFDCPVACEGIYADVDSEEIDGQRVQRTQKTENKEEELDKEKFCAVLKMYREFKTDYVRHFRFNSSADVMPYGENSTPIL